MDQSSGVILYLNNEVAEVHEIGIGSTLLFTEDAGSTSTDHGSQTFILAVHEVYRTPWVSLDGHLIHQVIMMEMVS